MPITYDVPRMMRHVYNRGLTTLSGGNLSMQMDDGTLWITPSGIDKGRLESGDVVCIKPDGSTEGKHRPSSEYPFHQAIYAVRDDVRVILHAHSPALVAYCIAHKVPDTKIIKEAYALCGDIGYADYVMPGSPQLGEKLAGVFSEGYDVVLMENHGVVTVGSNLQEAYARLVYATHVAQVNLHAETIGKTVRGDNLKREQWITPKSNSDTNELTQQLSGILSRGVEKHLFPDISAVASAHNETGYIRVSENGIVEQIEGEFPLPETKSFLIEAQAPHLMAFAVTHRQLDTRTIPEAYMTLHDVPLVDDDERAIETALMQYEAIIVRNSRVMVTGATPLQVYDRLEVLEYTARSAIEAGRIGGIVPMSEQAIRDLDEGYHRYYKGLSG